MFLKLFARPDPDEPLVTAARGGDARAFDALVHRYQDRLKQFVRSRLDSAIDAEDVAQEIFVIVWRELPRFRGQSRFKTWMYGIAVRQCAEAARRHLRLRMVIGEADEDADWSAHESHLNPFDWWMALTERAAVRDRLADLESHEREILELYYYAELNLPEIAQLLNVNLSTLKYRFYQAHRRLRGSMAAIDEETQAREAAGRARS